MTHFFRRTFALGLLFACLFAGCALSPVSAASTFDSGSTGADGAFAPTASVTLQVPDSGVFNYTTVNIPSGVVITFKRNNANTPVTILASGDITLSGVIDISGGAGGNMLNLLNGNSLDGTARSTGGSGGPGGFDGGGGGSKVGPYNGVAGDGPGGGGGAGDIKQNVGDGGGGSYSSAGQNGNYANGINGLGGSVYGSSFLNPLIGGSGGGGGGANGNAEAGSGGGGGGAFLIASSGILNFNGQIVTRGGVGGTDYNGGGGGGGAAGGIRVVATTITGNIIVDLNGGLGGLDANNSYSYRGGSGGAGYARLEAYNFTNVTLSPVNSVGVITTGSPGSVSSANVPQLQIVSVAGINAPPSPVGSLHAPPDITVKNTVANPVTVALAGKNIPVGTVVTVSLTPQTGTVTAVQSSALAGTTAASTATASVSLPDGKCILYASATIDLTAQTPGVARLKMGGEPVDKILVAAVYGGPSEVTYILHSGRKIVVASALLGTKPGRN